MLDPRRHEVTLVDAGHPPAYLNHAGKVIHAVDEAHTRLPLGVMDNADYVQVTHALDPGDQLVLYTDGISEAMNEADEPMVSGGCMSRWRCPARPLRLTARAS